MPKQKTNEEKMQFIKENMHLVPSKSKEQFPTWDLAKQYNKMIVYVSRSKKLNVSSIVKSITDKNPSAKDIEAIITQLQDWVSSATSRRIEAIQKQQAELAKELKQLTGE